MVMFPEVRHYNVEELKELFQGIREADVPEEEKELWLGEVAIKIAKTGAKGITFLLSCISTENAQRVRAILLAMSFVEQRLSSRNRNKICDQARKLLSDKRALVVAEAVD